MRRVLAHCAAYHSASRFASMSPVTAFGAVVPVRPLFALAMVVVNFARWSPDFEVQHHGWRFIQ